ncbi:MAG TPA: TonB-dependent receptor [Bryobacteraceae bacterium]|nr:TonB-dependent receptor [Bryobacteraceae bacterium]
MFSDNSRIRHGRFAIPAVWSAAFAGSLLLAQSTGSIQGKVTDQTGAVVPKAAVTVHNEGTGEDRSTLTDDAGLYQVPSLPIGRYRVSVKAPGLQPVAATGLVLEVSRIVEQDFQLQVAAATTEVQVVGSAPLIESNDVAVGAVIDEKTVQNIPLNGRHFVDLALLIPGTVTPPQNGFLTAPLRGQGSFSINTAGGREDTVNWMINGVNLNDMANNQITFQPSIDTVDEFKVDNSTYSAEYGRNSGAIVNIATRAGTNDFHGELFEYVRNSFFDARNFFNPSPILQSPFKRSNFGADGGGPIRKNKTFFYLTYEGLRQRQGITINQPVLTDAQRQQAITIGNPTVTKLLPLIPTVNSGSNLFVGSATAPVDIDQGTANISHDFNQNDRLNTYFAFQRDLRQEPTLQGNNIPDFGDTRQSHRQILTVNETHVFSPDLVNEARAGYNRIFITFTPNALLDPTAFDMNVGVSGDVGLPQVTVRDIGLNFGGPAGFPQGRGDYTAVLSDTLSYIRGKHSIKIGVEARRFDGNNFASTPGTLAFNTVSDFINGNIATFTASPGTNPSRIYATAVGAFVQDSYKLTPYITIDAGLRYDWNEAPTEADNRFVNFNPVTDELVRMGAGMSDVYSSSALNFQPRLGLAWDVFHNGKTVMRTAYAIMMDQPIENLVQPLASNPPFSNPVSFNGPGFVTFANAFTAAQAAGALAPTAVISNFTNDYVQTYNFNIQQEVTPDLSVMAGYFGNKGTHLRTARNINQFLPGTSLRPYAALAADSPIDPGVALGNIYQWESGGNSDYNALWVTATKRLAHNLEFQASYTFSKSIDYTSLNTQTGTVNLQNSDYTVGDRGLSDFDARHRFVFSPIYQLPFKGNRAVEGWNVALDVQLQTGNPVDLVTTSTYTGTPDTVRPNVLGPVPVGIGSAANGNPQYFSACSAASCLFQAPSGFGDLGRNVIIGPGFEDVDLSLFKDTKLTERTTVEFRVDTFNLFNHPNFGQPNRIVSTTAGNSFGQITSTRFPVGDAGSSRQLQLALKFIF